MLKKFRSSLKVVSIAALIVAFVTLLFMQFTAQQAAAQATAAATATPVPSPTPTFLPATEGTLTIWADDTRIGVITELGKQFTAKYNVPIRTQQVNFGDIRTGIKIAGPAGTGADIFVGAHDWLGDLVSNGVVAPLDLGDKVKNIDPIALKAFTYGGKLYGLPYGIDSIALYYNKDLVPTPPKTWDELKAIATKLQADKKVDQAYILPEGDPYHAEFLLTGFGGYVFGRDKDGNYDPKDLGIGSDGGVAAAQEIASMVKGGLLKPGQGVDTMDTQFKTGKSAFMIDGPWELPDVRKSDVKDKYGVAKIPTMKGTPRPFVGAQGFMINQFSKNADLAKAFLTDYIATDDAMQKIYDADPRVPAWLPVQKGVKDPDLAVFVQSIADGDPMPAIPAMNSVWASASNAYTLTLQGKGEPAQNMKDAQKAIADAIASGK